MLQYTDDEVEWAQAVIRNASVKELSPGNLKRSGLVAQFERKFGRTKTDVALSTWLRRLKDPEAYKETQARYNEGRGAGRGRGRPKQGTNDVFDKSNFVLFIPPNGIYGFDTPEEVVEGIKSSKITEGISLFKRTEVNVSFNVSIG